MNTESRIDAVCEFLRHNVANTLTMKKPFDDDMNRVAWVRPEVYPVYLPRPNPGLEWTSAAPCFVVIPIKDARDRMDGLLTLRIGVLTWDPGIRVETSGPELDSESVIHTEMSRDGWRTLHMTMDAIEFALVTKHSIMDMEVIPPITQSPYQEGELVPDMRPYYLGQIDVSMRYLLPRRVNKDIRRLLE